MQLAALRQLLISITSNSLIKVGKGEYADKSSEIQTSSHMDGSGEARMSANRSISGIMTLSAPTTSWGFVCCQSSIYLYAFLKTAQFGFSLFSTHPALEI